MGNTTFIFYILTSALLHLGLMLLMNGPLKSNKKVDKPKATTLFVTLSVPQEPKTIVKTPSKPKVTPPLKKQKSVKKYASSKVVKKSKTVVKVPTKEIQEIEVEVPDVRSVSNSVVRKSKNQYLRPQVGKQLAVEYAQQLKVFIEQNKKYPRIAKRLKQSGTVKIKLQINSDGTFENIRIIGPSQYKTLNSAAIKLLTQLGKFKPAPEWRVASKEFEVPIIYSLRRKI